MAQVRQLFESTRLSVGTDGKAERQELYFLVTEATDETAAVAAVRANTDKKDNSLKLLRSGIEIDERISDDAWRVRVDYSVRESDDDNESDDPNEYTFETTVGTMHRSVALDHVGDYAAANDVALNFNGAIGVDGDGNVQGCDVTMPQAGFVETVTIKKSKFTAKYKRTLMECTGKVNAKRFRGFDRKEVRFDGASASRIAGADAWRVTFRFSVSKNVKDLVVGNIEIGMKYGWDYLWFSYADVEQKREDTVVAVVRRPVAAHLEQVYEEVDFQALKIPRED